MPAFTRIELLVVIAIVAVLGALELPPGLDRARALPRRRRRPPPIAENGLNYGDVDGPPALFLSLAKPYRRSLRGTWDPADPADTERTLAGGHLPNPAATLAFTADAGLNYPYFCPVSVRTDGSLMRNSVAMGMVANPSGTLLTVDGVWVRRTYGGGSPSSRRS